MSLAEWIGVLFLKSKAYEPAARKASWRRSLPPEIVTSAEVSSWLRFIELSGSAFGSGREASTNLVVLWSRK